jgi:hypothetical protein
VSSYLWLITIILIFGDVLSATPGRSSAAALSAMRAELVQSMTARSARIAGIDQRISELAQSPSAGSTGGTSGVSASGEEIKRLTAERDTLAQQNLADSLALGSLNGNINALAPPGVCCRRRGASRGGSGPGIGASLAALALAGAGAATAGIASSPGAAASPPPAPSIAPVPPLDAQIVRPADASIDTALSGELGPVVNASIGSPTLAAMSGNSHPPATAQGGNPPEINPSSSERSPGTVSSGGSRGLNDKKDQGVTPGAEPRRRLLRGLKKHRPRATSNPANRPSRY